MASVPPKTLDFELLVKALEAEWQNPKSNGQSSPLRGGMRIAGEDTLGLRPIHDLEIWNRLVAELDPKFESRMLNGFRRSTEDHPLKLAPLAKPVSEQ